MKLKDESTGGPATSEPTGGASLGGMIDAEEENMQVGALPTVENVIKPQGGGIEKEVLEYGLMPTKSECFAGMDDHVTKSSSKTVMSKHAANFGCFKLNLGTDTGQKIYSMLMILLPMIPLIILIGRLGTLLYTNKASEEKLNV